MESALEGADPASQILAAIVLVALSGVPGVLARRFVPGQILAAVMAVAASLLGLTGTIRTLLEHRTTAFSLAWTLPFGPADLAVDPLSALFLIPVFLVFGCGSLYALGYWPAAANRSTEPALTFFYGILAAAMAGLVVARNGVLFLMAWEAMALSAWFLLATEHRDPAVRQAGIVYLAATHAGTAALFVLFCVLRGVTGSFVFPAPHSLDPALVPATVLFLAALAGFGAKAGIMPLHIWLPAAHASAPSHVSALMSGVMLKMGLYGLVRTISFFAPVPLWWGGLILVLGAVSALAGIVLAASQRDLKRLLACSSIENIGIIALGIGTALVGEATGNVPLYTLGMTGALLHLLNHSLFKPLLFFGAGAVIHATGTREMDRMGGLARLMPRSALFFLVGSVAICGLPPLNGFVGEFLLYAGFFGEAVADPVPLLALSAPLLAVVGGIATVSFVKLYGVIFLGVPRCGAHHHSHLPDWRMGAPMGLLALLCLAAGIAPGPVLSLVEPAVGAFGMVPPAPLETLVPLGWLTLGAGMLGAAVILSGLLLMFRLKRTPAARGTTWGCGYPAPSPRMQYTGVSFADSLVRQFEGVVAPRREGPAVAGFFPAPVLFRFVPTETILERVIMPLFRVAGFSFAFLRRLQHGRLHLYMLYILTTLFLLMVWAH
ncbi:proton-conducting transporter membrane subunit [Geobacter sulfurreducens]|uniref:proton-conducting transporter transmembrane domain-containing protein n=1 Tax=Geobacter sulfurreducens TaxID=35554 RepID=UPI0001D8F207|nr:proton-conducting transporter membrane subunit [Geobacter sulfurreducens]ADI83580.1 Ech-hydrogenase-related complex, NuoL-like integral membrane subunit [Geobacter sulfurreducens KN400]